ncbi:MAG: 3-oxoacyl-[acyl-carrier protein] reductase [Solirubrobacteraceae bacterium]|jgi:NAD(P)-dependent dehydrogenase (short-subunit alcohol dehydrogenase family)|nr:3-oxoacyl-[acyl-carrier protein] reductase [Solirubrobacteraceae bacterium]
MRALVTGARGGIGRAIVSELEAAGSTVAACDLPGTGAAVAFDQRDAEAVRAGVDEAVALLGGLDVVVANAGVVDTIHRSDRFPAEAWARDLEANLTGAFLLAQAAFGALKAGVAPAIVFVSSASAELGLPGQAAYTASKAGLVGLMRTLAAEWGPLGIRVNVVMPGLIGTPKVRALPEPLLAGMAQSIPLGRMGEPEDVARTIAFLAGPGAAYVHGQVLRIDGGLGLSTASLATGGR